MSATFRVTALAVALGLMAGACSEQPAPTAAGEAVFSTGSRTFDNFSNNPDNGNDRIFRFEQDVFLLLFQFPNDFPPPGIPDLVAIHSSTPDCGGILEPVSTQWVQDNPDDPISAKIREVLLADPINIFVVDFAQEGNCFGLNLVASGTGKLVNTDNDLFVFLRPHNNANAFGFTAQGRLTTPGGDRVHYNGVSKLVWDGEDFSTFKVNEHFNLK